MRKFFDKIKTKWQENKAEFILQALSLVLASTLLLIGVSINSSAQESRDVPNYTVPAGTYTFNATLTAPPIASGYDINVSFTSGGANYNRINIADTSGITVKYRTTAGTISTVYNENNNGWKSTTIRTIRTNEDMYLAPSFYQWFIDNTNFDAPDIPVPEPDPEPDPDPDPDPENPSILPEGGTFIPAGTYTFNEDINHLLIGGVLEDVIINVPFYFKTSQNVAYSADQIYWSGAAYSTLYYPYTGNYWSEPPFPAFDDTSDVAYIPIYEKTSLTTNGPGEWLYPNARTITLVRDVEVPPDVYNWFRENVTISGEPIVPPDGGVGDFMASLIKGVFNALDSCELYAGLTLLDVLKASLGVCLIIWLLKLLAGG